VRVKKERRRKGEGKRRKADEKEGKQMK